jgi:hypothetical protein
MRLTGQVWVAESVTVVSWLTVWLAHLAQLAVESIGTCFGELKCLLSPGTWARAHGPRQSESLMSVGLPEWPKARVALTDPGLREVHLMT